MYSSLSNGWTYLNADVCPQVPERVASAVARSFRLAASVSPPEAASGSHSRRLIGQPEGLNYLASARYAIADLVGATANRVVLGPSLPVLYASLIAAMRPQFRYNSSVVVTHLDRPELHAGLSLVDADVRRAHADLGTGELPAWQFTELVSGTTRLITVPAAHHQLGTLVDVADVVDMVHERSRAWVLVDASAYAAYRCIDFDEWGADIVGIDVSQIGGPQISALVFRDTAMFRRLGGTVALDVAPGLAGGAAEAVEHLAVLAALQQPASGKVTRRDRLKASMTQTTAYMDHLRDDLYTFLGTLPAVHIMGASGEAAAEAAPDRLPVLTFGVRGVPAATVYERLIDNGIVTSLAAPSPLLTDMGLEEMNGAVTVGLSPFNTEADINQLIRVVASLA
nr:aminotransferase class V-fold PLP-dependent enzyme [Corynebacterium aquatimens]